MAKKKSGRGGARPGAGRKPMVPGQTMVSLSLRITPTLKRKLDERAKQYGTTFNRVVQLYLLHAEQSKGINQKVERQTR